MNTASSQSDRKEKELAVSASRPLTFTPRVETRKLTSNRSKENTLRTERSMMNATDRSQNPALSSASGWAAAAKGGSLSEGARSAGGGKPAPEVQLSCNWSAEISGSSLGVRSSIAAACYGILHRQSKGGISASPHRKWQSATATMPAVSARKMRVPRPAM